ncbi:hypothetical protein [Sphingomonas sp. VNH70]|uniref:hypothetical protein n=1 Tax=Sphingomonas silueang TaxID=3156617 RepID=UPI0032B4F9D0
MPTTPFPWRPIGWSAAGALLLLPLVAGAPWTLSDYVFAAVLLGIAGGAIEVAVRMSASLSYRLGALVATAAAFLLVWVNAAVGLLGDEENDANAVFLIVLLVAVGGTLLARLRAAGTARAMLAAAGAQLLAGITGWAMGWAAPGGQGVYEVTVGTGLFGTLWLVAAALFARAARHSAQRRTASPSI